MDASTKRRPVVLCVFDGWGHRDEQQDNAIAQAKTPNFDRLRAQGPAALLDTDGTEVGLPTGQMGNSEVGHLNLGAGRIVDQDIRRIDGAIEDGTLASNAALAQFIENLSATGGTCHLMGLVSPGGVHSHQDQMVALARIVDTKGIPVAIHAFLDGRDTPPKSADQYLKRFDGDISGLKRTAIATVCGRYWAMDRDNRWERVEHAYDLLTAGRGNAAADVAQAVQAGYGEDETDEFMTPATIGGFSGMEDGDGLLMANFRADRAREILTALLDPAFDGFARNLTISFATACGMVEYSDQLNRLITALFPPVSLEGILGGVLADAGLKQLRIAETEKYAHVTFFFNGGIEAPFPGEERALIPSPKVATYDLKPEMSAIEVTDRLVREIEGGSFDFIFVNYANPDMVGHTGNLDAAIKAIETVDACLGRLEAALGSAGGAMIVTADHGNAETMRDPDSGAPFTSHTTNRVPALLVGAGEAIGGLADGRLADVAPTLLALMGLSLPKQMTGRSLLLTTGRTSDHAREPVSA